MCSLISDILSVVLMAYPPVPCIGKYIYTVLRIAELDCCQIIVLSIYIPSTHAYTHVLRISLD